jgi:hypothetical protein
VVDAGGVLYNGADSHLKDTAKKKFYKACNIAFGNLHCDFLSDEDSLTIDQELAFLLSLKEQYPALQQLSSRRKIETSDDSKFYAFLKTDMESTQRMLVVLNFQPGQQKIKIDLSGLSFASLTDVKTKEKIAGAKDIEINCNGLGYRFFSIENK